MKTREAGIMANFSVSIESFDIPTQIKTRLKAALFCSEVWIGLKTKLKASIKLISISWANLSCKQNGEHIMIKITHK